MGDLITQRVQIECVACCNSFAVDVSVPMRVLPPERTCAMCEAWAKVIESVDLHASLEAEEDRAYHTAESQALRDAVEIYVEARDADR